MRPRSNAAQAAVPGATVTAAAEDAATTRVAVTDMRGEAELAALNPSTRYVVTVELQGFQTSRQEDFLVRAGQTASARVTLTAGNVTETVVVTAASPVVDVTSAVVAEDITLDLTEAVPTGRTYQSYLQHGGLGVPYQHGVLRDRDHVVEPRAGIQEVEDLRCRKARVEPNEEPRPWKRAAQQRQQPRHQGHCSLGGHRVAGPQHRRTEVLLRFAAERHERQQRQIAPLACSRSNVATTGLPTSSGNRTRCGIVGFVTEGPPLCEQRLSPTVF